MKLHPVGADVGAEELVVASGRHREARFDNDPASHKKLIRVLTKDGRGARVVLEATGVYSLDLYMSALVAIQHEPNVAAFYEKLVASGKSKMQAIIAVMRKLLHAIFGMLQHGAGFDGKKVYAITA
jgi:transposase